MKQGVKDIITQAGAAVLATTGPHGLNVVPVSVVEIEGEEIHLYDFFMRKTAENIKAEPKVALTCWGGTRGCQIKGEARYEMAGEAFERATRKMLERFPDRVLAAVIRLTPIEIYDVAPGMKGQKMTDV